MKAVWKLSGEFYGWISDNGWCYIKNGTRFGTVVNDVLYNHNGRYHGDVLNNRYIGYNYDRNFLEGPECYLDAEIYLEPLDSIEPMDIVGYADPS